MANKSHLSAHLKLPDYQSALSPYVRKLILENTYSAHQDTKVLNKDGLIDFSYICSKLDGKYRTKRIRGCFVDKRKNTISMTLHYGNGSIREPYVPNGYTPLLIFSIGNNGKRQKVS